MATFAKASQKQAWSEENDWRWPSAWKGQVVFSQENPGITRFVFVQTDNRLLVDADRQSEPRLYQHLRFFRPG